jgi:SNF2 family DNA or RNA helicase
MPIADTLPSGYRPKQIEGALRIYQGNGVILADEPGAGKTLQALFALELRGLFRTQSTILIMCNVTGCQLTWAGELELRIASQYDVVIADLTDTLGRKTMPSVAKREQSDADHVRHPLERCGD